jgi:MFS family permease
MAPRLPELTPAAAEAKSAVYPGGKRLWMFALSVFLVGSVGSSLAWNAGSLIAWRVVQGAGGGLMLPVSPR